VGRTGLELPIFRLEADRTEMNDIGTKQWAEPFASGWSDRARRKQGEVANTSTAKGREILKLFWCRGGRGS